MNRDYTLGKYEYSNWTAGLAVSMFLGGIGYGIATRKSPLATFGFALVGAMVGFSIGSVIKKPKRIIN